MEMILFPLVIGILVARGMARRIDARKGDAQFADEWRGAQDIRRR